MKKAPWQDVGRYSRLATAAVFSVALLYACTRQADVIDAKLLQEKYGVQGVYADRIATSDGSMEATVVPVTLANGDKATLLIPKHRSDYNYPIYMRDRDGIHPVLLSDSSMSREQFVNAAATPVQHRTVTEPRTRRKTRSFEKEALIVGGSAAGGAAIGALAGGGKGAGIGALSGGIAGLVYDLSTRKK